MVLCNHRHQRLAGQAESLRESALLYFTEVVLVAVTLEKLQKHISSKMPSADAEFLTQLTSTLFEKATSDFLESFDTEGMMAIALGVKGF